MKKNNIYIILGVAIISVTGWFMWNGNFYAPKNISEDNSLRSLMDTGIIQECSFVSFADGYENNGTVYLDKDRARGDFVSETKAGTFQKHFIIKNGVMYAWSDDSTLGIIASIPPKTDMAEGGVNNLSMDQKRAFFCQDWVLIDEVFNLPGGIAFNNAGEMSMTTGTPAAVDGVNQVTDEVLKYRCELCAQMSTEEVRAQCRETVGCK